MASAFGKVTGLPGAVTATNGPGVTHLPVGCRDALLDGAPLIALPGALPHRQAQTQAFQEVDSPVLLAPFTVSSIGVWSEAGLTRLSSLVSQCRDMSAPVSASLAQDVPMESAAAPRPAVIVPPDGWTSRRDSIDRAVAMFSGAKRPVIVVGDVRLAPDGMLPWLRLGAAPLPVLSAPSSMPEAGRLHAGNQEAWDALRSADLLIAVGGWPGDVLAELSAPTILLSTRPFHIAGTPPSEILVRVFRERIR
jgi:acetolactate synthase-1/2/3 large subunit